MTPTPKSADTREALAAKLREAHDRSLDAEHAEARRLVSVSSIDIERLIAECVPGGSVCDPQQVADAIRRYCDAWPNVASDSQPSEQTK